MGFYLSDKDRKMLIRKAERELPLDLRFNLKCDQGGMDVRLEVLTDDDTTVGMLSTKLTESSICLSEGLWVREDKRGDGIADLLSKYQFDFVAQACDAEWIGATTRSEHEVISATRRGWIPVTCALMKTTLLYKPVIR